MANWTDIPEADFAASQDIEITSVLAAKKRPHTPSRFKFERVNEATWKLTNGEMTNVPTRLGFGVATALRKLSPGGHITEY